MAPRGRRSGSSGRSMTAAFLFVLVALTTTTRRVAALGEAHGAVLEGNIYKLNKTVNADGSVGGGGASVQGDNDVQGPAVTYTGKGYIITFEEKDCAVTPTCHKPVQDRMAVLGCEACTLYDALNMMGCICFTRGPSTPGEQRRAALQNVARLKKLPGIRGVTVNIQIQLNPKDPNSVWGYWGWPPRQPRQPSPRPRWGWGPAPTPRAPAPVPAPAPKPAAPSPPAATPPTQPSQPTQPQQPVGETNPDPNFYNWGLDRANQETRPLDRSLRQCPSRGTGVFVYVLDTGCRATHQEIAGRATTESVDVDGYRPFGQGSDGHGHGTHCAGTAAGINVGMAPGATVRCIKVLGDDGSGMLDHVVAGLNMVGREKKANPARHMIASLSLGASAATAGRVNDAVTALSQLGVVSVVAAGNSNQDAKNFVPASCDAALTVGATDEQDIKASYSNYGQDVDIYAPGSNIYSSFHTSDSAYKTMSGTSMATPAVAGGVACLMAADMSKVCSTASEPAAKRVAAKLTGSVVPGRRLGDPEITQKILFIPSDSTVSCPDT